jgi:diguanylate cyclase (GGDEF)-like protein
MKKGVLGKGSKGSVARRRLAFTRTLLVLLVAVLATTSVYVSTLIVQRNEALQQTSRYNISFTIGQAAVEIARLQTVIAAYVVQPAPQQADTVMLWHDIVAGRISVLESSEVGDFIQSDPRRGEVIASFRATLQASEALLPQMAEPGVAMRLLDMWARLNVPLTRLTSSAHGEGGNQVTSDLQQLSRLHWSFSYLLIGMILASFGLIIVLGWNNQLLSRANDEVQQLLRDLRSTSGELEAAHVRLGQAMLEAQDQNSVLRRRDLELNTQNTRFDAALTNMSQALCMADGQGQVIVCNSRFLSLFEVDSSATEAGTPTNKLYDVVEKSRAFGFAALRRVREAQQAWIDEHLAGTVVVEDDDGRALAVSHRPMEGGGWVATYEDVTAQRSAEARIRFLALHDALTSLPNRTLFRERLEGALARRDVAGVPALLCLDLDNFKIVNDTMGHPIGDALLKAVGERLSSCVRGADVVARLGGDEFAVLHDATSLEDALALARRITEVVGRPYHIDGRRVITGVSIGIALADRPGLTADLLHQNADLALYRAKAGGRSTWRVFAAEMEAEVQARLAIELDLREAMGRDELELFYQPQIDLLSGRLVGCEALMRWRHPERGLVPPSRFIPIAEDLGLITAMGQWALNRACADAAQWDEAVKVAVNLSPVQFTTGDVVPVVSEALRHSGLKPYRLELEITESVLLQDNPATLKTLQDLRALGVRIALDDFGTGYSSLSYLRHYPFDKIKIDRSFVSEIETRPDCAAIVDSIAILARTLGMSTTAEGIETEEQLRLVSLAGCTEGQGYYFGRPLPLNEMTLLHHPGNDAVGGA